MSYTFESWYEKIKFNVIPVVKLAKSCYEQGIIIDVGSNLGSFTDSMMETFPQSEYHLFEPHPKFSDYLTSKYENVPNVHMNLVGCGEKETASKISFSPGNWGHNKISSHGDDINIVRLDSYIKNNKLNNIGLIKIDVEFYEPFVLNGLKNYIKTTPNLPPIILEHNWGGCPYKHKWYEIVEWLFDYYQPFKFDEDIPMYDLILLPR